MSKNQKNFKMYDITQAWHEHGSMNREPKKQRRHMNSTKKQNQQETKQSDLKS